MGPQGVYISNCLHSNPSVCVSAYTHIHWITIFFSSKNTQRHTDSGKSTGDDSFVLRLADLENSSFYLRFLGVAQKLYFNVNPRSNLGFSHPIYYFLEPKITQLRRYRYLSKNKNSRFFSFLFSIFCNCLQIQNFLVKLRQPAEF